MHKLDYNPLIDMKLQFAGAPCDTKRDLPKTQLSNHSNSFTKPPDGRCNALTISLPSHEKGLLCFHCQSTVLYLIPMKNINQVQQINSQIQRSKAYPHSHYRGEQKGITDLVCKQSHLNVLASNFNMPDILHIVTSKLK